MALFNATMWIRNGISPVSLLGSDAEQVTNLFRACRAPFMRNWLSQYSFVLNSPISCSANFNDTTVATTTLPAGGVIEGWGFAIAKSCSNVAVAVDVINALTSSDEQLKRAQLSSFLPSRASTVSELCSGSPPVWFGCFVYSANVFESPADEAAAAYTNISTYFSTWMNAQYGVLSRATVLLLCRLITRFLHFLQILPSITDSPSMEISSAQAQEILNQLSSNLGRAATELESILNQAGEGKFCGLAYGVVISCQPGLSCLNGACVNVTTIIVG